MGMVSAAGDRIRPICDRFWLFSIAGIALAVVGFILVSIVVNGKMPEGAGELFSASIMGLLMIVQKVIEAQSTRRLTDALHQSSPHGSAATGKEDDPIHQIEDAA